MKRKFKQWWASISPITTKRTTTSRLNWTHWIQERSLYAIGNPGLFLGITSFEATHCFQIIILFYIFNMRNDMIKLHLNRYNPFLIKLIIRVRLLLGVELNLATPFSNIRLLWFITFFYALPNNTHLHSFKCNHLGIILPNVLPVLRTCAKVVYLLKSSFTLFVI